MKTFLISDTHFHHGNILTFRREDGSPLRPFSSVREMDATLIDNWNAVVAPTDRVYHLGDVCMSNATHLSRIMSALNGTKILIKGNHDNLKLGVYKELFKDVRASHTLDWFLLTHIPIHPDSLSRWTANIHGHLHYKKLPDSRYYNVSVECINYTPIDFEEIRESFKH